MAHARFTPNLSGLYHLPAGRRAALLDAAAEAGLSACTADLGACGDRAGALSALGQALGLPQHYGNNLDALYDCLTDAEVQPATGLLLLIEGLASLQQHDRDGAEALVEVLEAAAAASGEEGYRMFVVLDAPLFETAPFPAA